MVIRVYWASVTGNRKISGDQNRLRNLIESLKIESEWIDVTTDRAVMNQMRTECSNSKALPPQIFNEEIYLGTVDDMNQSIEDDRVWEWLKIDKGTWETKGPTYEEGNVPHIAEKASEVQTSESYAVDSPANNKPSEVTAYGKSVSSAVSNFEISNKSPKVSRKSVELQFDKKNQTNGNNNVKLDEERRRRILGLPPSGESEGDKANDEAHDTNGIQDTDISKLRSIYEVRNAAS